METSPIRFSKRNAVGGNILGRYTIVETIAHTFYISYQVIAHQTGNVTLTFSEGYNQVNR